MCRMVTVKYNLMNVLEDAMNDSSKWRQQCEACPSLQDCINSWLLHRKSPADDCLTARELEQYVEQFFNFMNQRMRKCQDCHRN